MDRVAPALLMGTWLPPVMIQGHEQQLGAGDGDGVTDGDDGIDGDLYNIYIIIIPSMMQQPAAVQSVNGAA